MSWKRTLAKTARRIGVDIQRYPPRRTNADSDVVRCLDGDVVRCLRGLDRPVVFDVGANEGQSVARFSAMVPGCEIHSFEPSPSTFALLTANAGTRAQVSNVAVGAYAGMIEFHDNTVSVMSSALSLGKDGWGDDTRIIEVPQITLDNYCAEHGVARIDLLKTDTQGYDLEVLRGADRMLSAGSVDLVLTEVNFSEMYANQGRADRLFGYLFDRGFHLVSVYDLRYQGPRLGWCDALFAR